MKNFTHSSSSNPISFPYFPLYFPSFFWMASSSAWAASSSSGNSMLRNRNKDECVTSRLPELPEVIRQLELSLDLRAQLLHLPPWLRVLAAHDLDDGCEHRHPHQDVDSAHQHVTGLVPANKVYNENILILQFCKSEIYPEQYLQILLLS